VSGTGRVEEEPKKEKKNKLLNYKGKGRGGEKQRDNKMEVKWKKEKVKRLFGPRGEEYPVGVIL
jgi:hypothetical protein